PPAWSSSSCTTPSPRPTRHFPRCLRSVRGGDDDGGRSRARRMTSSHLFFGLAAIALVALGTLLAACTGRASPPARTAGSPPAAGSPAVTVERTDFHGWQALVLRNTVAEVTVVPAIGRIMQLGLRDAGGARGPLWSHPGIGRELPPDENGWINFGGDKAWPAP